MSELSGAKSGFSGRMNDLPGGESDQSPGTVYLVGAGPGDPALITLRGLELLRRVDVVVYDRLGAPVLMEECRPDAELIFVGKGPGAHTLSQDEINRVLVDKARLGLMVVRLKGGDPFVFGRGGEEAEALAAAGIPFEVVPGVTSAVAVPAYAGIPLTRRGVASSFAVVTSHRALGEVDEGLGVVSGADTLVLMMCLSRLGEVARALIERGRPAGTPVAVIASGTTGGQRTVTGSLDDIAGRVREAALRNPALAVVGEVVSMRSKLSWFETRPLFGRRILVTRRRDQAGALSRLIAERGGETVEIPLIRILPPGDLAPLDAVLAEFGRTDPSKSGYRWIVFTSANGVRFFMRHLAERGGDGRALAGVGLACVGEGTAKVLAEHGLRADLVPAEFRGRSLVEPLLERCGPGDRVLLARGDLAARDLPEGLAAGGVTVDEVVVYRTRRDEEGADEIRRLLGAGKLDVVTLASPSAAEGFAAALEDDEVGLLGDTVVAVIGPVTERAARRLGLPVHVAPSRSTLPALVDALADHFSS